MDAHFQLIVGLGNPGKKYEFTRHNIGFLAVDQIVAANELSWNEHKRWQAHVARDGARTFVKPQTFMNRSGFAVEAVRRFYQIPKEKVLLVYDDLDLPLGVMRLKNGGRAAGHNGVKDILACLETKDIARLKIGIGRQPQVEEEEKSAFLDVSSYVLGCFEEKEMLFVEKILAQVQDAVHCACLYGLSQAMNQFNRKVLPPKL